MSRFALLLAFAFCALDTTRADVFDDGMTLVQAIEALRNEGYDISYSTGLVERWMRVRQPPDVEAPIEALGTALSVYGLDLVDGGDGRWLVVRASGDAARDPDEPAAAAREAPADREPQPLDEIVIVASQHALYSQVAAARFLSDEDIQLMPHMADDAFRAMHRLPGVAASDFQAPFNLRGGTADEVKIQLNGIELIEPYHMQTLFNPLSVIDPGIIGTAEVYSGGFTARHGNFMSGVIDIQAEDADHEPLHELGISFVSAFGRSSGTFASGRGSYLLSARRGYLDLLADSITDEGEELEPRYSDLFGNLRYALGDRFELSLGTLLAEDDVSFVNPGDGEDFGEASSLGYGWLTASYRPVANLATTTSLYVGGRHSSEDGVRFDAPDADIRRYFDRDIDVLGARTDWVLTVTPDTIIEWGARYRDLEATFDYRLNSVRQLAFINNGLPVSLDRDVRLSSTGSDVGTYLSWRQRPSTRLIWELGLRWDKQSYVGAVADSQASPRANLAYRLTDRAELRLAWGDFHQAQAIQALDIADGDVSYYEPERAEHRILGFRYESRSGLSLQLDLYDKRYRQLRPRYESLLDLYEFGAESNFDRARVEPSSGRARGAELTLRDENESGFDWWLNYSISKVDDTVAGVTIPRSWDQRHAVTGNLIWRGERWSVSAVARYHSGWPRTPLVATPIFDAGGVIVGVDVDLTKRNSERFDDYSRVDVRVTRRVPLARGSFEYYLEVFNVFDTANPCCTSNHVFDVGASVSVSPLFDNYLPLFPSFGFVWRFGAGASDID